MSFLLGGSVPHIHRVYPTKVGHPRVWVLEFGFRGLGFIRLRLRTWALKGVKLRAKSVLRM